MAREERSTNALFWKCKKLSLHLLLLLFLLRYANSHETKTTYVFIVGIEGVGHHAMLPFLGTIARLTGHIVLGTDEPFSGKKRAIRAMIADCHDRNDTATVQQYFRTLHSKINPNAAIIEYASFPFAYLNRNTNLTAIKSNGHYDLEWIYAALQPISSEVTIKFLYLTRDFYRAVQSHIEIDGNFVTHAKVLETHMHHIYSEYRLIEKIKPDQWRQLRFEWFQHPENCRGIVNSVVRFLNWEAGHEEEACAEFLANYQEPKVRPFNWENFRYAMSLKHDYPVPLLGVDGLIDT